MSIERQGVLLMFSALTHKDFYVREKVTNKIHLAKFVLKNIWKNKL